MIELQDIEKAAARLDRVAHRTPVLRSRTLDERTGATVYLKAENLQRAGAFKFRGAYNRISTLSPEQLAAGVVAYSSGNHAQAVALAARLVGTHATILMPRDAPSTKVEATVGYGAEVVRYDRYRDDRAALAARLATERALTLVPPFDDDLVMAGQGTAALELLHDVADLELLMTPIGGGGLIAGSATAAKALLPRIRVIGVEPELAADAQASLRSGNLVELPAEQVGRTIADGLRVRKLGDAPFEHVRAFVDDIITVSDDEILEAMRRLALRVRLVAEPSGAVSFAACLFHRDELPATRLNVAVLSGGNVEPHLLARVLAD
jgi:threonine dehydratase